MFILLRREFTVELPVKDAWQHLSRVEEWPSWASHIKQVKVQAGTVLSPNSTGIIYLNNGIKSAFTMIEFNPYHNWKWVGRFLWLTVHYDHIFEELDPHGTRLTWVVEGDGLGVSIFGKLFAKIYNKNLDKAIPALVEEMNASKSGTA